MSDSIKGIDEQLQALNEQYRKSLQRTLDELEQSALQLRKGILTEELSEPLFQKLHKLAGSAGSFGYAQVSQNAHTLHALLGQWRQTGLADVSAIQLGSFASGLMGLRQYFDLRTFENTTKLVASDTPSSELKHSIWLVEDDHEMRVYLQHQLEAYGYDVTPFESLTDAEAACEEKPPHLLLLDILFPDENRNATETLLKTSPLTHLGCPLIFISAHDDFQSRIRAARLGAEGYFVKPLDLVRLVNRIDQLIDKQMMSPERILIVEDDHLLASHYQLVLQQAGMVAEVLDNPVQIIDTLSAFKPDLILMDVYMPDFSGPELAGLVRQYDHWASLSIVYLSAESDLTRQVEAMRNRADDFIMKPVSDQQLVSAVRVRVARSRELNNLIMRDSLTGLLRHVMIKDAAASALARAQRYQSQVCFAMLDIDHFKNINDSYGHACGDMVISSIALLLKQRLRQTDIIGRYGGEEFLVVLPDCTPEAAVELVNSLRVAFSELPFSASGRTFHTTFSAGLSCYDSSAEQSIEEILEQADRMLYQAKAAGRNKVCINAPE